MSDNKLRLVWDINLSCVKINDIDIVVVPETTAAFDIDAVVEEQDTALILGKPGKIVESINKPAWFLANKLESQSLLKPGSVIKHDGKPIRLLAIVHDLDREPSWSAEWITQALENIFKLSTIHGIFSLQLSVLGAEHGRFKLKEFLPLLINELNKAQTTLRKIYLSVPKQDYPEALSLLRTLSINQV